MTDTTTTPVPDLPERKAFPADRLMKLAAAREKAIEVRRRNAMIRRKDELERITAKLAPPAVAPEPVPETVSEVAPPVADADVPAPISDDEEPPAPKVVKRSRRSRRSLWNSHRTIRTSLSPIKTSSLSSVFGVRKKILHPRNRRAFPNRHRSVHHPRRSCLRNNNKSKACTIACSRAVSPGRDLAAGRKIFPPTSNHQTPRSVFNYFFGRIQFSKMMIGLDDHHLLILILI